jgi:hypothetical protein
MVSIAEGSSGAVTGFSRDYFEHFGYTLSVNYGSAVGSDFNPNSFSFWSGNTKWIYFESYSDVLIEGPENFTVTVNKYVLPGHEGDAQIGPDGPTSRIEVQIDDKTVIPVKVPLFNIPFSDPIFRTVEVDWKNYTEVLDKLNIYRKEYAAAISEAKNLIYQAEIENAEAMQKGVALNRKNALFAGHDAGAENWATIASLVETCKLNAVDPHAWLTDTLTAIVNGHKQSDIDALLPWNYTAL